MTTISQQHLRELSPFEQLLHYRRSVAGIYAYLRRTDLSDEEKCRQFRLKREQLFATHPQSALSEEQRARFRGLQYYPYDPSWRFVLPVDTDVAQETTEIELQGDGPVRMQRFGQIHFEVGGQSVSLSLFWVMGYGGGIFLPFRDLTNEQSTYGGGRYLLDTIKEADLGHDGGRLVIDFNYAYNPSCAYNPEWHCPLAPHENWLPIAISAGEMRYPVGRRRLSSRC